MKKSKIIIPALGMLLLSTAASVTGTVAWFTSLQTGSAQITSFAVTKTGGSLETELVAGNGTELNGAAVGGSIVLKGTGTTTVDTDDAILTHGSYDHTTDSIWKPNDALDTFTQVARPTSGNGYAWTVDGSSESAPGNIYYAVSWTINFNYTFSADTKDVYLFFDGSVGDAKTSTFTPLKADGSAVGTSGHLTYKGFRIAMVGGAKIIWAPGTNVVADEKYQSGATGSSVTAYGTHNTYVSGGSLIDADGYANIKSGTLSNPTSRADYLGTFQYSNANSTTKVCTLAVTCIAWYEGNDQNVVDDAELDKVSAALGFYTRIAA